MGRLFSVIVPVYNVEKYLRRCIDSILNQTYKNMEIILVDDGSTDGSYDICLEYAKKDNRIKVIHKENGGLSSARNAGLNCMQGDYVCFVDSDDFIEKELLMKCAYRLDMGYEICSFCARRIDENEKYLYEMQYESGIGEYKITDDNRQKFIVNEVLMYKVGWEVCFQAYSCKFIINNNFRFDENVKFAEDMVFTMQVIQNVSKYIKIPDILYNYTYRENSLSVDIDNSKNISTYMNLYSAIYKEVINMNIDTIYLSTYFWTIMQYSVNEIFHGNNIMNARKQMLEIANENSLNDCIFYVCKDKKKINDLVGKERAFSIISTAKYLKSGNAFMYKLRRKLHSKGII